MVMVRCARRAFTKKSTVAKGVTAQAAREAFLVHDETRVGRKTPRLPIFARTNENTKNICSEKTKFM